MRRHTDANRYTYIYDMDTDRMKKVFGEANYTYGYKLIDDVILETGLMRKVQGSSFIASDDMTKDDFDDIVDQLYSQLPWYGHCCNGGIGLKTIVMCDYQKSYAKTHDVDNYDYTLPYRIKPETPIKSKNEQKSSQMSIDDDFDMDR